MPAASGTYTIATPTRPKTTGTRITITFMTVMLAYGGSDKTSVLHLLVFHIVFSIED